MKRCTQMLIVMLLATGATAEKTAEQIRDAAKRNVKQAVQAVFGAPFDNSPVKRNVDRIDWQAIGTTSHLRASDMRLLKNMHRSVAYSVEFTPEANPVGKRKRVTVIAGESTEDAALGLYEYIGETTSRDLTAADFRVVTNGPGDHCFVRNAGILDASLSSHMYFLRDNLAVSVMASDPENLLPIAKAIDKGILGGAYQERRSEAAARESNANRHECFKRMRTLAMAREQVLLRSKRALGATVSPEELAPFVKRTGATTNALVCPSGGLYTFTAAGSEEVPTCSIHGQMVSGTSLTGF